MKGTSLLWVVKVFLVALAMVCSIGNEATHTASSAPYVDGLVVIEPLLLSPASPVAGASVTVSFTVRNSGVSPVTLPKIGVGGRGPGCSDFACVTSFRDFPWVENVTISAGQTYTYRGERSFPTSGAHFVQIAYETSSTGWHFLGDRMDVQVGPGLVVVDPLRLEPDSPTNQDLVVVSFALGNEAAVPIHLERVGVGARGPDCALDAWDCAANVDFFFDGVVTLLPGEQRRFQGMRLLAETGAYFAQISIEDRPGNWTNIANRIAFSVTAASNPVRSTPLAFGVQWHPTWDDAQDEAALGLAASIGAKVLRLGLSWRLLEPNGKGQWDTTWYFPAVRYRIEQARSYGMDVQILLLQTPCWASSDPAKRCIAGNETWDDAYPPANYRDYADAFRKLIEAYGDLVNTWEVWNEPNIERFWKPAPDADAYVQLLAVTYSAIKAVQSDAVVLGASLAGADLDYLWAMYDADAKGRFDALALHPYSTPRAPDDCTEREWSFTCGIDQVRSLMLRRGDDRPIYLTEFGWSTYSGIDGVSEETQRQYLIEALESLAVREYVTAAAWYTLVDTTFASLPVELPYDNDFGLFTANHRPKLAAVWLQTQLSKPFELFLPTVRR